MFYLLQFITSKYDRQFPQYNKEKQSPVGVVWDDVVTVLDAGLTGEKNDVENETFFN